MVLSGAAGLVWQLIWTAQISLVLGHEMVAVLAVLAAYFGGLSLGAYLFDRRIQASSQPGRVYACLELAIALWALVMSLFLPSVLPLVAPWLGATPHPVWHWFLAFALPLLLLLPATVAMGATLPAMNRQLQLTEKPALGTLYGANTLGAMLGVLLAVFVFLPFLGILHTVWFFAAINGICGLTAWLVWRQIQSNSLQEVADSHAASHQPAHEPVNKPTLHLDVEHPGTISQIEPLPTRRRVVFWLFATGFLGIAYEVLCVRVLSQVTENTVYTYAILLAVYLLGSALGASFYQRAIARGKICSMDRLLGVLLVSLAVSGASLWGSEVLGNTVARWSNSSAHAAAAVIAAEALLAAAAMLLPTMAMGAMFTHVCTLAGRSGLSLGRALAANMLGGALAPFLVGAVLIPAVGARTVLCLLVLGYGLLGSLSLSREPSRWLAVGGLLLFAIAAGPLRFVDVPAGGRIISYRDGIMASVSVVEDAAGTARLHINNRVQEGSSASGLVEVRLAQLPLLMHPAPRRALFLGLGTGYTAHAAAVDPQLRVDAVELLPEVVAASRLFALKSGAPIAASPVNLIAADARRYVQSTDKRYDVVVSDLFHPARSGAANLYTAEHFHAVQQRLLPGGIFCQWLALHQMDLETFKTIVASFMQVYPQGFAVLASNSLDTPVIGLVARAGNAPIRAQDIALRLATMTPAQISSHKTAHLEDVYAVLGSVIAGPQVLKAYAADAIPNTDDHPSVAYRAPWAIAARGDAPRQRLADLLAAWTPTQDAWLDSSDNAVSRRLTAYWQARKSYLELGLRTQAKVDPVMMLKQLQQPLLDIVAQSPDFRPAAEPLEAMAQAVEASTPLLAAQVRTQLKLALKL